MARNDSDITAAEWKRKYYDSLEELEDKEKQWSETETVLRLLVSRLTLIADNTDRNLAKKLKKLRQAIRDEQSSFAFRRLVDDISVDISKFDKQDKPQVKSINPAEALLMLLNKMEVPDKLRRQEKHLRKQFEKADEQTNMAPLVENMTQLMDYINEYTSSTDLTPQPELQNQSKPQTEEKEPEESSGFFRLFGKKTKEEEAKPAIDEDELTILKQSIERNSMHDLAQPEELSAASPPQVEEPAIDLDKDEIQSAAEILIDLINQLKLPPDLTISADLIKQRLKRVSSRDDLVACIDELAILVSEVHERVVRERGELEAFLKQLTGRLSEIDEDIQVSAKLHEESYQQSQSFNSTMNNEMNSIQDSVTGATELEALKSMIQSRVIVIRNHMDKYIESEEQRHQQSSKLIEHLQKRVETMESETATLKEEVRKKQDEATRDALTGVANRQAYNERLEVEIARNRRYQTPLTMLVWDVDKFKSINDTYGHAAGDKVLKVIAKLLSMKIRETDFIARYGGEEFVILMPETEVGPAELVANKLRKMIEDAEFHFKEKRVVITASCGIAEIKHNETAEQLFERADNALYSAKEAGRNRCIRAK